MTHIPESQDCQAVQSRTTHLPYCISPYCCPPRLRCVHFDCRGLSLATCTCFCRQVNRWCCYISAVPTFRSLQTLHAMSDYVMEATGAWKIILHIPLNRLLTKRVKDSRLGHSDALKGNTHIFGVVFSSTDLICIRYIDRLPALCDVAHNPRSPRNFDLLFLLHLLQRRSRTHIEQLGHEEPGSRRVSRAG